MRRVLCVLSRVLLRSALGLGRPSLSASAARPCPFGWPCSLWLRRRAVVCAVCKLPATASLVAASAASLVVVVGVVLILFRVTTVLCSTGGEGGRGATGRVPPGPENQGSRNALPPGRSRRWGTRQPGLKGAVGLFLQAAVHPQATRGRRGVEGGCLRP